MAYELETPIRAYFFDEEVGSFKTIDTIEHVTHDFSQPRLEQFFKDDSPQKDNLIHMDTMARFSLYWVADEARYEKNVPLYNLTGVAFFGKIMLFRQRDSSPRFGDLDSHDLEKLTESLRWWLQVVQM